MIALVGKITDLERTVAMLCEEIARLKGLKGRPQITPSGMEQAPHRHSRATEAGGGASGPGAPS